MNSVAYMSAGVELPLAFTNVQ